MGIYGKGEKVREIPIHPQLRTALPGWLDERPGWPGADNPALFLNQRGSRLSVKGAHDIITSIAATAGLDDDTTTHLLRHTHPAGTWRDRPRRRRGDARPRAPRDNARLHRPTREDAVKALELLDVDH